MIAAPFMVVALNEQEAQEMQADTTACFARFGGAAALRRKQFEALRDRLRSGPAVLTDSPADRHAVEWPRAFYGSQRSDWSPFGATASKMREFVTKAARRVNDASPGSRERRVLKKAHIQPVEYSFDEYLRDRFGSRDNIERVCDLGCLILLDEFALLHPDVCEAVDALLHYDNLAVVSSSACDPTLEPIGELIGLDSHFRVGNLLRRFCHLEDLSCELALNSPERLQRWLRLVLPELLTTLGQKHVHPALIDKADELLAITGGKA
jgi:hypothetical protein